LPSLLSGDLKESLEKLVQKANATLKADGEDQAPLALRVGSPLRSPLLSNSSDRSTSQRIYATIGKPPPSSCSYAHIAPARLVSGSAPSSAAAAPGPVQGHLIGRMVSQPSQASVQSHRSSTQRLQADGQVQVVLGDDVAIQEAAAYWKEDANVQALREKVREALSQQTSQDSNLLAAPSSGYAPPSVAVADSPGRRGSGTRWDAQVTAVLQAQQQVPPRPGGTYAHTAHSPNSNAARQARALDVYIANTSKQASGGQPGSFVSPAGSANVTSRSPVVQAVPRTHSPVTMHRGLSPVAIRQQPVQRTLSPVRGQQLA